MPAARNIFAPPTGERRTMYADGDTGDIIRVMMHADRLSKNYVTDQVKALRGPDDYHTLENIYWYVKKNVRYKADKPGAEEVRSPGYLFDTATGDCKSLSIAIGALCRAFGIPYRYRFIRQRGAPNFHHVYVVADTRDGSSRDPVILDAVYRTFDSEPAYSKSIDLKPGQRVPASIGASIGAVPRGTWLVLLLLIIWFANSKQVK